jgi:hypothetical protein
MKCPQTTCLASIWTKSKWNRATTPGVEHLKSGLSLRLMSPSRVAE